MLQKLVSPGQFKNTLWTASLIIYQACNCISCHCIARIKTKCFKTNRVLNGNSLTYVLQNENILSGTTVLAESDSNQTPAMIQAKHFPFFF